MVHSVILLEERSGTTVGLIEQTRWCREKGSRGKRHKRKERAYEDKERFKWERASRRVTARLGEVMGRVISVCDREADVYEYLGYKTRCDERYVVRSSWDRRVKGEWRRLNEELANAPKLGRGDGEGGATRRPTGAHGAVGAASVSSEAASAKAIGRGGRDRGQCRIGAGVRSA